jgi:parvulin-like peptidyl-prolyl isomerase
MIHLHNKVVTGYFGPNQMVKPFNDFVFNNGIGKVGLVETDFGFTLSKSQINKTEFV